jgi:hypothetical protein
MRDGLLEGPCLPRQTTSRGGREASVQSREMDGLDWIP